ncbi:hypothetical protein MMC30_000860 [Trapelia coarctata]|nr:hypothetical protein [Trapelia coarctata]
MAGQLATMSTSTSDLNDNAKNALPLEPSPSGQSAVKDYVTAIVAAFDDGLDIIQSIKEKRERTQTELPPTYLINTLTAGPAAVETELKRGVARFGTAFEIGDDVATGELKDIMAELQAGLVHRFRRMETNDDFTKFVELRNIFESGRDNAVWTLRQLHKYMATALSRKEGLLRRPVPVQPRPRKLELAPKRPLPFLEGLPSVQATERIVEIPSQSTDLYSVPNPASSSDSRKSVTRHRKPMAVPNRSEYHHHDNPLRGMRSSGSLLTLSPLMPKAKPGSEADEQEDPLYQAVSRNYFGTVQILLRRGADINLVVGDKGNPLYCAVYAGNFRMVELPLRKGADINMKAGILGTPLLCAVSRNQFNMVELLLKSGADVNAAAPRLGTPVYIAKLLKREDIVELLLKWGADANSERYHPRNVTQTLDIAQGKEERGQNDKQASTALKAEYENNVPDIPFGEGMELLLERGPDANLEVHNLRYALPGSNLTQGNERAGQNRIQPSTSWHAENHDNMVDPTTVELVTSEDVVETAPERLELPSKTYPVLLREKLLRPKVRPGYRRVEWTCECGDRLYDDFDNTAPETVDMMEDMLNRPSGGEHSSSSHSSSSSLTLPVAAYLGVGGETQPPSGIEAGGSGLKLGKQGKTEIKDCPSGQQDVERYFELCLNHDSLEKRLGEINLTNVRNDGELFEKIRERYAEIRGPSIKRLYLLKPVDIHYVRFSLEDRHRVWIFEEPSSWPPKEEVEARRWDFEHPINPPPPMPPKAFLHYMQSSKPHRNKTWLPRLPKKLEVSMLREAVDLPSAWGVSIVEGADKAMILLLLGFALSMSLVIAILWSVLKKDAAVGMAIGTYLVALVAITATFLAAKWQHL